MSATNLSCNDGFNDPNRAILEFMLHHDNVRSPIDAVMSAYVRQCAVSVAIAPGIAPIAVWSSNLDYTGNSMLGVRALEMLNARTGWSVSAPPIA